MARKQRQRSLKAVETLTHEGENRRNIPTAEYQSVMRDSARTGGIANLRGSGVRAATGAVVASER